MRDPWVRGLKLKCPQGQLAEVRREVGWERGDLHRPPHPVHRGCLATAIWWAQGGQRFIERVGIAVFM